MKTPDTAPHTDQVRSQQFEEHDIAVSEKGMKMMAYFMRDKIYTDKPLAVVREYLANAIDEHRNLQKKGRLDSSTKVQVSLPRDSQSSPELRIRDFGLGLDKKGIVEVFGAYGNSTKDMENISIGGFGIGAKSGHAYSSTFNVTTWHKGKMSTYSFVMDGGKKGEGKILTIVDGIDSDEPSGIEVSVPIQREDVDRFRSIYKGFAPFCAKLVEVLDEDFDTGNSIIDSTRFSIELATAVPSANVVVCGFIPYQISEEVFNHCESKGYELALKEDSDIPAHILRFYIERLKMYQRSNKIVRVPIGSVSPALNRESLEDDKETRRTLVRAYAELYSHSIKKASEHFNRAKKAKNTKEYNAAVLKNMEDSSGAASNFWRNLAIATSVDDIWFEDTLQNVDFPVIFEQDDDLFVSTEFARPEDTNAHKVVFFAEDASANKIDKKKSFVFAPHVKSAAAYLLHGVTPPKDGDIREWAEKLVDAKIQDFGMRHSLVEPKEAVRHDRPLYENFKKQKIFARTGVYVMHADLHGYNRNHAPLFNKEADKFTDDAVREDFLKKANVAMRKVLVDFILQELFSMGFASLQASLFSKDGKSLSIDEAHSTRSFAQFESAAKSIKTDTYGMPCSITSIWNKRGLLNDSKRVLDKAPSNFGFIIGNGGSRLGYGGLDQLLDSPLNLENTDGFLIRNKKNKSKLSLTCVSWEKDKTYTKGKLLGRMRQLLVEKIPAKKEEERMVAQFRNGSSVLISDGSEKENWMMFLAQEAARALYSDKGVSIEQIDMSESSKTCAVAEFAHKVLGRNIETDPNKAVIEIHTSDLVSDALGNAIDIDDLEGKNVVVFGSNDIEYRNDQFLQRYGNFDMCVNEKVRTERGDSPIHHHQALHFLRFFEKTVGFDDHVVVATRRANLSKIERRAKKVLAGHEFILDRLNALSLKQQKMFAAMFSEGFVSSKSEIIDKVCGENSLIHTCRQLNGSFGRTSFVSCPALEKFVKFVEKDKASTTQGAFSDLINGKGLEKIYSDEEICKFKINSLKTKAFNDLSKKLNEIYALGLEEAEAWKEKEFKKIAKEFARIPLTIREKLLKLHVFIRSCAEVDSRKTNDAIISDYAFNKIWKKL